MLLADDGQDVEGVPTEGVEITCFHLVSFSSILMLTMTVTCAKSSSQARVWKGLLKLDRIWIGLARFQARSSTSPEFNDNPKVKLVQNLIWSKFK